MESVIGRGAGFAHIFSSPFFFLGRLGGGGGVWWFLQIQKLVLKLELFVLGTPAPLTSLPAFTSPGSFLPSSLSLMLRCVCSRLPIMWQDALSPCLLLRRGSVAQLSARAYVAIWVGGVEIQNFLEGLLHAFQQELAAAWLWKVSESVLLWLPWAGVC